MTAQLPEEEEPGQAAGALGQPPSLPPDISINPFRNDSRDLRNFSSLYEILKTILLAPLCVLRLLLFVLCLVVGFYATKLALLGAKDVLKKPFTPWRRRLFWPVRICARVLLFACGYQWIHIKGKPADRSLAPVLVSNHVTFVDPVFIFFQHLPVIVTAQENLNMPIAGAIMKAMQVIAVNRVSQDSRRNASGEIKRRAMCNDWSHVMIFPEATTTNGRVLVSFKAGAFTPGFAVQPVVIRYPHVHLDPSWTAEGPAIFSLLLRLMTQFHNFMEVEYLPIIQPTFQEQKNPRLFAERVRIEMAKALNVMVTEHSYEDSALGVEAVKNKFRSSVALLEFGKFEKLFKLNIKEAKHFFTKFQELDVNRRGVVTYHDFVTTLDLPSSTLLRQVFRFFDQPGRGYINFRQYVVGLAFVTKHKKYKEALDTAFKLCDVDEDGLLSRDETRSSLKSIIPYITDEQIQKFLEKLDAKNTKVISRAEFIHFLESNPEYLVVFLISTPDSLPQSKKLSDCEFLLKNGRILSSYQGQEAI